MSQSHTLLINADDQPELLERLLRIVRHRGFRLTSLDMHHIGDSNAVEITLQVKSDRPIANLQSQLDKLWDVSRVRLLPLEQQ
ncbi:acetolactate synthase 2 small subunit [Grimontia hollisae]|uniref:Acetolactate synthase small subunit n=2 Tax=Grimontia hollisae TaxID=673 RepID=D0I2W1_GRIHO|nr:acetolactate synthase 2 small subunit [Grimontia hollisae]AMG30629.1 acetolactate synthase 2 small subunit [Grimontia hollisae]EEY74161.1 acetolactate synthase small subunit [Grimontia hollisae CIP 101886]MDF2183601.1 acetolactate synthase 2 small subunit [Grimontia hollisae]STO47753.1 Acetolactate synthase isozyme 2 small subunit [Grimontia hollisae]STO58553.1 Acetolactate synthase isozyme 2 small subunit [Grimontia hollisae]